MVKFNWASVTLHTSHGLLASFGEGDVYRVYTLVVSSLSYAFKTILCTPLKSFLSSFLSKSTLLNVTSFVSKFFNAFGKVPSLSGSYVIVLRSTSVVASFFLRNHSSVTLLIDSKPALLFHTNLNLTLLDNL